MVVLWIIWLISRVREKGIGIDLFDSYLEPAQVPLGEKPKMCECKGAKGTRQIGSVPSEEGVPVVVSQDAIAGRSD